MIVAVRVVRMVQVSRDQVIDMIPVWDPLVSATRPVHMVLCVTAAGMLGGAVPGVRCGDGQDVIVDVVTMNVVQMTIMEVVGVVAVPDSLMTAAWPVLVVMTLVHVTIVLSHVMLLRTFGPSCSTGHPQGRPAIPGSVSLAGSRGAAGVSASPDPGASPGVDADLRACFRASLASRLSFCFCSLARLAAV